MLTAQKVYGPDGIAVATSGDVALGRALYKLLPEDDEDRQPLVSGDKRFVFVADARIDDRDELLERLGRSGPPATAADASILFACLQRWGEQALDFVLGDYAFALWDRQRCRLVLACDPLGQRPLYYHQGSGFVAAASMPKGLHVLPEVPRSADAEWLTEFIGYIPHRGPRTQFRSIERVEPGHVVRIEKGRVESTRFWDPEPRDLGTKDFASLREALRAELDRAVRVRLRRREGAVAAHLSGGWDSGSVASTAASLLANEGSALVAFTSVPRPASASLPLANRFTDEGPLAAAVAARHRNIEHVLVPGSAASPIMPLDKLFELYERPAATLCNNVWMSEIRTIARQRHCRVLLTGEVGNWTISGGSYLLLGEYVRLGRWGAWLREARAIARKRVMRPRGILANSLILLLPRELVAMAMPLSSARIHGADYNPAHPALAPVIAKKRRKLFRRQPKSHFGSTAHGLKHREFGDYRKGALASSGIDERDPTADRRLAEFCLSLPLEMLLKNGERRPLAKAALSDRLPAAVLEQKARGYQAPDWHEGLTANRSAILDLIEEISTDSMAASLLDIEAMRRWVRDWPSGGWEDPRITARYRNALLVGLSAGHFALRANR